MNPVWYDVFLDVPRERWQTSVRFWAAVTGWEPSTPRGERDQFLTLVPASGSSWLRLQAIDDGVPRVHLDVATHDRASTERLAVELGAELAWRYDDGATFRSPGGLLFCVTTAEPDPRMVRRSAAVPDQMCLDIPPHAWESEVAFWRDLSGRSITTGRLDHFVRLVDADPAGPVRFLLQRLGQEQDDVCAHPDLAVADRAAETARHLELGAVVDAVHHAWTIMRAPDGVTYCLTDRDPLTGQVAD